MIIIVIIINDNNSINNNNKLILSFSLFIQNDQKINFKHQN